MVPLLFEPDRAARAYHKLARQTGTTLVSVSSPQAIEVVLPALVAGRVRGVFATNEHTGQRTQDLLDRETMRFDGELALRPGANDIELRVESERGTAALFRFRVQAAAEFLGSYLARLRLQNRDLELQVEEIVDERHRQLRTVRHRSLWVGPEPAATAETPAPPQR